MLGGLLAAVVLAAPTVTACSLVQRVQAASEPAPPLAPLGPADLPMPASARTPDAEGAEAFARYYVVLMNLAAGTAVVGPMQDFSYRCDACARWWQRIYGQAAKERNADFRHEHGQTVVIDARAEVTDVQHGDDGRVDWASSEVELVVKIAASREVLATTGDPLPGSEKPARDWQGTIRLIWSDDDSSWATEDLPGGW